MKVSRESLIITFIGLADLVTTIIFVHYHQAQEANPLFARFLDMGFGWFSLMKLVFLAGPILILEWARRRSPVFTRWGARFAILAYLALYSVGVSRLNQESDAPRAVVPASMVHAPPFLGGADPFSLHLPGRFSDNKIGNLTPQDLVFLSEPTAK